jgi:FtsH-binding integral membrane protein
MSDFDRNIAAASYDRTLSRAETAAIDQGLRAYMLQIYNYMAIGLAITGLAALGVYMLSVTDTAANAAYLLRSVGGRMQLIPATAGMAVGAKDILLTNFGAVMFASWLKYVFMLLPLAFVLVLSFGIERMRPATAQLTFWLFSLAMGISLSTIFLVYTHESVVRVFFITAASFGALSLWGYTTQRDLSAMGAFLMMGLIGIIIASLVNMFLGSSGLQFIISVLGVLIFAGLTAWDTQRLKSEYVYGRMEGDVAARASIMGALSLYLNFINLFTFLLQLFGQRNE